MRSSMPDTGHTSPCSSGSRGAVCSALGPLHSSEAASLPESLISERRSFSSQGLCRDVGFSPPGTPWCAVLGPVVLTSISARWLSESVGEHVAWSLLAGATGYMCLFLWTLICLTTLVSCWAEHQLTAGAVVVGVALVSFALYLVQGLGQFSLFTIIDVRVFMDMRDGVWPWWQIGGLLLAGGIMLLAADWRLRSRDF